MVIVISVVNLVLPAYRCQTTAAPQPPLMPSWQLSWQSPDKYFCQAPANGSHYFCDLQCQHHLKPLIIFHSLRPINVNFASAGCTSTTSYRSPRVDCHVNDKDLADGRTSTL